MNKVIFYTVCSVLLMVSCQDIKVPEKPKNLIPKDTMVMIFTDAYLVNAARNLNAQIIKKNKVALDSLLYKKYNIDSLQFAESNAYYSLDISTYSAILEKVEKNLLKRKTLMDSLLKKHEAEKKAKKKKEIEEKKKLKDSLFKGNRIIRVPSSNK